MNEQNKNDNILKNCSFVKTVLMVLIILGHSCDFWTGAWFTENPIIKSQGLNMFASWIGSFHIYTFALVSGYIFAYKFLAGAYKQYIPFVKNKIKRLIIPYFFSMLIWVAPITAYFLKLDMVDLFEKYILCINPSQLWFLWMLFWVFIIVWPLRKLMASKPIVGWIIVLIFYFLGACGQVIVPNVFCIWTAFQYIVFFYLGMRIRIKGENNEKMIFDVESCYVWIILYVVLFIICFLFNDQKVVMPSIFSLILGFLLHIVGAIMAWTILQKLAMRIKWGKNSFMNTLSSYSMPMYLFHQQFIYFTIVVLNGVVNPWINAGVNFGVALIGSFVISAFFMSFKVTRILIGEKP